MASSCPEKMAALEERIGYRFRDPLLLEEALTHRSYLNENKTACGTDNERLEFLGDAVLSLFISHRLFAAFPGRREGELSRLRAVIVDEAANADMAELLEIGGCLCLGRGEERSGGREKRSVLADTYEALIAAVYLDGGAAAVDPIISRHYLHFAPRLNDQSTGRDSKSEFQEFAQSRHGATPHYLTSAAGGPDHARIYTAIACLGDEQMGEGTGRSKKEAEQEAARQALESLRR